jgi:hypothetical protein
VKTSSSSASLSINNISLVMAISQFIKAVSRDINQEKGKTYAKM